MDTNGPKPLCKCILYNSSHSSIRARCGLEAIWVSVRLYHFPIEISAQQLTLKVPIQLKAKLAESPDFSGTVKYLMHIGVDGLYQQIVMGERMIRHVKFQCPQWR